jgi:hypothetical protein
MHILNINGDALHLRLGLLDDYGVDLSLGQTSEKSSNDKWLTEFHYYIYLFINNNESIYYIN